MLEAASPELAFADIVSRCNNEKMKNRSLEFGGAASYSELKLGTE